MNGAAGTDTADYFLGRSSGRVVADLTVGRAVGAGTDQLVDIENLFGTRNGDAVLIGDENANLIFGGFLMGRPLGTT